MISVLEILARRDDARTAEDARAAIAAAERERHHEIAREMRQTMRCNCDLDNWEPTRLTGHSQVCRIHKATLAKARGGRP